MNEIKIFENPEFGKVRTVQVNGEPWLVGKDVAEALGYSNTKDALAKHVDNEDKQIIQRSQFTTLENHIPKSVFPVDFVSAEIPNRGLTVINESGIYSLVLSSKLPTAKKFKRWVTSEVLPSIRKHGAYMNDETLKRAILEPDFLIKLATELKEEKEHRRQLEEKIDSDKPKVIFADAVSTAKTSILIGDLAKLIKQNGVDIGQKRLFEYLRENGYLIKRQGSDRNMPTQRSMEMGLFEVKETAITHSDGHTTVSKTPKVTGKGQEYFVNKFLTDGSE
jgi:anti-repressor protein